MKLTESQIRRIVQQEIKRIFELERYVGKTVDEIVKSPSPPQAFPGVVGAPVAEKRPCTTINAEISSTEAQIAALTSSDADQAKKPALQQALDDLKSEQQTCSGD